VWRVRKGEGENLWTGCLCGQKKERGNGQVAQEFFFAQRKSAALHLFPSLLLLCYRIGSFFKSHELSFRPQLLLSTAINRTLSIKQDEPYKVCRVACGHTHGKELVIPTNKTTNRLRHLAMQDGRQTQNSHSFTTIPTCLFSTCRNASALPHHISRNNGPLLPPPSRACPPRKVASPTTARHSQRKTP